MIKLWDENYPWLESDIQAYIVLKLRRDPGYNRDWMFAADMNGQVVDHNATKEVQEAQALEAYRLGLETGETDLRFWLPHGRSLHIELKRAKDGRPSQVQRKRIKLLRKFGHKAGIVRTRSPWHGYQQVASILNRSTQISFFSLLLKP